MLSHLRLGAAQPARLGPRCARILFHFGKWIFLSTAVFYLSQWGDRLLLGWYVLPATLGIYTFARQWSDALVSLASQLARNVLYAGLSNVARERAGEVSRLFYKARLRIDLLLLPLTGGLIACGYTFVETVFRKEWWAAGWMLELLCVQAATRTVLEPTEQCIMVLGRTRVLFIGQVSRTVWAMATIPLGWHLGGLTGVIVSVGLSDLPVLLLYWSTLRRLGVLNVLLEARSFLLLAAGFVAGRGFERVWEAIWPAIR